MSEAQQLHRLRVRYIKAGRLAYLGHLEVLNTINRSIRRSGLPFSVGNGFARRIRLQFSQALPVGASSEAEYYDLMLTSRVDPAEALRRLAEATPTGLAPQQARYLPRKVPALEAWANRSAWSVQLDAPGATVEAWDQALQALVSEGTLGYMRGDKPKTIDLGVSLVSCQATRREGGLDLRLDTRSTNDGALRPAILVGAALAQPQMKGVAMEALRVCRLGQWHESQSGGLVEPLAMEPDAASGKLS
ncbi:MAG: TIGR03936 family radical SAM-associated protein [Coriobacteriales bacterium]|nr:TIGR03936 family radical SAM-associated protein [Coriobacteriales bacterium]